MEEIIILSGGLSNNADANNIEITRFIDDISRETIMINDYDLSRSFYLEAEDHIAVRKKKDYKRQDIVHIKGEVKYPGRYSIVVGETTIGDIIEKCGGLSSKADPEKIIINNKYLSTQIDIEVERILLILDENRSDAERAYLKARTRTPKGNLSSSTGEFTNQILDFIIHPDDIVEIPKYIEYVELLGAFNHPGRYPYVKNNTVEDYINSAGGFTKNATRKKYIIKSNSGQRIPFSDNVKIENGDVIFVAETLEYNGWTRFKEITSVVGQIATIYLVIQSASGN